MQMKVIFKGRVFWFPLANMNNGHRYNVIKDILHIEQQNLNYPRQMYKYDHDYSITVREIMPILINNIQLTAMIYMLITFLWTDS